MDTQSIIAELEAERDRLNQAIAALQRTGRGRGRRAAVGGSINGRRGRRKLSAAARSQQPQESGGRRPKQRDAIAYKWLLNRISELKAQQLVKQANA